MQHHNFNNILVGNKSTGNQCVREAFAKINKFSLEPKNLKRIRSGCKSKKIIKESVEFSNVKVKSKIFFAFN